VILLIPSLVLAEEESVPSEVRSVGYVNLQRYVGLWHEIARIPNRFQKDCTGPTTAEYRLRGDGRIDVINRCVQENGDEQSAEGIARVIDNSGNARLQVSFVSFLGWRPFWGDYWILGLDPEYQWAAVGTPNRKYGWILCRTPTIPTQLLDDIFAIFERNGYDRTLFVQSPSE
jgi:apolipoprotein D and lipocalin family protein